ncbi:MAG: hypothetical protein K2O84_06725 [Oscillospiraceae bacterium]|nr:hypothetical protein [Oscillospiraceae bacterium]
MAGDQGPTEGSGAVSVESKVVAALAPFGDPVEAALLYAAAQELPPKYYTFSCTSSGDDFGDDLPGCERWRVSVHFFAPLDENVTERVRKTKAALFQAGFTWPRSEDASDQDERHFVFECEITDGVDTAQWEA